jgi:hypothetical protein
MDPILPAAAALSRSTGSGGYDDSRRNARFNRVRNYALMSDRATKARPP